MQANLKNNELNSIINLGNNLKDLITCLLNKLNGILKEKTVDESIYILKLMDKLEIIDNLVNSLIIKLKSLEIFELEHVNFLSIKNMITYITSDVNRFIKFSSFANNLTISLCNLINKKIELFDNGNYESYYDVYEEFDDNLFKNEEFFYLNIYENTNEYDYLINKITNLLW